MAAMSQTSAAPISRLSIRDLQQTLEDAHRKLDETRADPPIRFRCRLEDIWFDGRVDRGPDGLMRLRMIADLGVIPYTIEEPQARQRLMALAAWRENGRSHFAVSRKSRLNLLCQGRVEEPIDPRRIVGAAARLAIEARPLIELAKDVRSGGGDSAPQPAPTLTLASTRRRLSAA